MRSIDIHVSVLNSVMCIILRISIARCSKHKPGPCVLYNYDGNSFFSMIIAHSTLPDPGVSFQTRG